MRITLATFGSLGDIHPMMALARELQQRGHEPIIATSDLYRRKIEDEGFGFHAMRPHLPPPSESKELIAKVMDARTGSEYLFRELLMPALRDSYDDLYVIAARSDLLISHPATPAAPLVAEKLAMKWMTAVLAPISLWSIYDPPALTLLALFARWRRNRFSLSLQRAIKRLARRVTARWVSEVYELRAELGLPRDRHPIFEGQYSPFGTLALFSKVLAAPQPDWPRHTTICGTCFYDKRGALEGLGDEYSAAELHPELRAFLENGAPPIVFTLGSAAVFDARGFFEESTLAARQLNRRALLLIGEETNRPAGLPYNDAQVAAFDYAPYSEVFSRAAAIVHQGGAGTTGQVLRSGAPSLVMPYSHDQPDNAIRLERLGVARIIPRRKYSAARAARELDTLLNEESYTRRAREIAGVVRSENGPRTAADAIERVLKNS